MMLLDLSRLPREENFQHALIASKKLRLKLAVDLETCRYILHFLVSISIKHHTFRYTAGELISVAGDMRINGALHETVGDESVICCCMRKAMMRKMSNHLRGYPA